MCYSSGTPASSLCQFCSRAVCKRFRHIIALHKPFQVSACIHKYTCVLALVNTCSELFFFCQVQPVYSLFSTPCDCHVVHPLQTSLPQGLCSVHHKGSTYILYLLLHLVVSGNALILTASILHYLMSFST